jgi:hypothetical protein
MQGFDCGVSSTEKLVQAVAKIKVWWLIPSAHFYAHFSIVWLSVGKNK